MGIACAQNPPAFEAASLKRADPAAQAHPRLSAHGGPGTDRPTRFECRGCTLALLVAQAYGLDLYQVAGPDWIFGDVFEVAATVPEHATVEQFHQMLQGLLAERFGLKIRTETRETAGFELHPGPDIARLKEAGPPPDLPETTPPPMSRLDAQGYPILVPGEVLAMVYGRYRRHTQETIPELVKWLTIWLGKPVIDRTGLTGRYEFTLSFFRASPGQTAELDVPAATLEDAVNKTGLRLISKKVRVDYVEVASSQRIPAEN